MVDFIDKGNYSGGSDNQWKPYKRRCSIRWARFLTVYTNSPLTGFFLPDYLWTTNSACVHGVPSCFDHPFLIACGHRWCLCACEFQPNPLTCLPDGLFYTFWACLASAVTICGKFLVINLLIMYVLHTHVYPLVLLSFWQNSFGTRNCSRETNVKVNFLHWVWAVLWLDIKALVTLFPMVIRTLEVLRMVWQKNYPNFTVGYL